MTNDRDDEIDSDDGTSERVVELLDWIATNPDNNPYATVELRGDEPWPLQRSVTKRGPLIDVGGVYLSTLATVGSGLTWEGAGPDWLAQWPVGCDISFRELVKRLHAGEVVEDVVVEAIAACLGMALDLSGRVMRSSELGDLLIDACKEIRFIPSTLRSLLGFMATFGAWTIRDPSIPDDEETE